MFIYMTLDNIKDHSVKPTVRMHTVLYITAIILTVNALLLRQFLYLMTYDDLSKQSTDVSQ